MRNSGNPVFEGGYFKNQLQGKNMIFSTPEANMRSVAIIFRRKQLQIDFYKPPTMIWAEILWVAIKNSPNLRIWSKTVIETQKIAVIQAKLIYIEKVDFFKTKK